MYPSHGSNLRAPVALVYSHRSREAYAAEAKARGEVYTFNDARGSSKTWLKGEYAYLAPNAASAVLSRCNLKHDWMDEADIAAKGLSGYRALVVPNAGHLTDQTVAEIIRWLEGGDGHLLVSGKTNLPNEVLGLAAKATVEPAAHTGWHWLPDSPFGDPRRWEDRYVTGYRGHQVQRVTPASGSRVLAELLELIGDTADPGLVVSSPIGPAVILSHRTVYLANQPFELLGGVMQAHLNVEDVRRWYNPALWGDTLALFLRQLLIEVGAGGLWETRLRSFGAYSGAFSFRQDVHGHFDDSALKYEIDNLIPATFCIEDPAISPNTSAAQAEKWVEATRGYSFIEQALHNDSVVGDPPNAVRGAGLLEHVRAAGQRLGFQITTGGRHGGGHMHPETLDAMDYLYANEPEFLGLCTFSFYHMIEYGVRNPEVQAVGTSLTYVTNPDPTIATPAFWFPYHPVVTTDSEWRVMRGWDRTHDYDSPYHLVDTILWNHCSRIPGPDDRLENGVFSFQYHPEFARDLAKNDGRGTLGYLLYAVNLAERLNLWIANEQQLYRRMSDYEALAFSVAEDGTVHLHNPTKRRIVGLALERRIPFESAWDETHELIHVVGGRFITVPPLDPGQSTVIRFDSQPSRAPRVSHPSHKGLEFLDARHDPGTEETLVTISVCREQQIQVDGVEGGRRYQVEIREALSASPLATSLVMADTPASLGMKGWPGATSGAGVAATLRLEVRGDHNRFVERIVSLTPA